MLRRTILSKSKSAKDINRSACIEAASIEITCTRDIYARKGIAVGGPFFVGGAYIKNTCAGDPSAFKHLEMHLQSF